MKSVSNFDSLSAGKIIISLSLLVLMLLGYFHPILAWTQDLGRHILTGEVILKTLQIPTTNMYSYTYPSYPFINTHWLSEVVFALLNSTTGAPGLFILMLLLIAIAGTLQGLAIYKQVSPYALCLGGILYIRILLERTDLRPELFSFLFLSIFIVILYRFREKTSKWILLLIPLQLLWVNMHIYFAIGLVIQALFLIDLLYSSRKNIYTTQVKLSLLTLGGSIIASLINPNGIQGMLYPLFVFNNYGYTIEENQTVFLLESLGFIKPSFPFLKIAVVLLFVSLAVSFKKTRPIDWMLSITFTVLAFSATRNLPLFVYATFIPFMLYVSELIRKSMLPIKEHVFFKKYGVYTLFSLCSLLLLWQSFSITSLFPLGYGVIPGAKAAVDFLQKENITGPLFNNFDIGGYLLSRLYPNEQVFVDGRPEAYPASFFRDIYIPMQQDKALFDKVVSEQHIVTVFFPHTDQTPWGITFLQMIIRHPDWHLIYVDDYAIILLKQTPSNEALIKKYYMNPNKLRITRPSNTFDANLRIVAFLMKIQLPEQAIPYLQDLIKQKPDYCPAIGMLTEILQAKQDPSMLIYAQKYQQSCL